MPRVDRPAENGGREARRTAQSFSLDVDKFPLAAREEEERPRRREEEKLERGGAKRGLERIERGGGSKKRGRKGTVFSSGENFAG